MLLSGGLRGFAEAEKLLHASHSRLKAIAAYFTKGNGNREAREYDCARRMGRKALDDKSTQRWEQSPISYGLLALTV
jgi:hypothetical protein